jgi:DNA/RNA-binding protein KIN17
MNSTRWVTLTEFVKHLGRTGVARVDETEKGWFLAWIDNSPKALAKQVRWYRQLYCYNTSCRHSRSQEAALKKERLTVSDEQRERMLIAEQIERATAAPPDANKSDGSTPAPAPEEGLKRSEGVEKVVLSLSAKPSTTEPDSRPTVGVGGLKMNPLKAPSTNPLKRASVFKASAPTSTAGAGVVSDKGKKRHMSAAESLIYEEQERKRRKMEREGGM